MLVWAISSYLRMPLRERGLSVKSNGLLQSSLLIFGIVSAAMAQDAAKAPAHVVLENAATYTLQPSDQITLHSLQVKEVADRVFHLDEEGQVNCPLIGRVRLADLTAQGAEELLQTKLKAYYLQPDLELEITALHPEPVSVIGAVGNPGVHEMKGRTSLLDAISMAGGARADAGSTVVVTRQASRGMIPYSTAHATFSGESVASFNLRDLLDGVDLKENIVILPHDVISISSAQVVYVVGNVKHPGGFTLAGKSDLTVLQALSLAEGLDPRASPERTRIIRRTQLPEQQIAINLKQILAGKSEDLVLQPNDILFVPTSTAKVITSRSIEAAITIGTGLAIFATHF
jgi:polysaccharide biosynthesis/export protein